MGFFGLVLVFRGIFVSFIGFERVGFLGKFCWIVVSLGLIQEGVWRLDLVFRSILVGFVGFERVGFLGKFCWIVVSFRGILVGFVGFERVGFLRRFCFESLGLIQIGFFGLDLVIRGFWVCFVGFERVSFLGRFCWIVEDGFFGPLLWGSAYERRQSSCKCVRR